MGQRMRDARKKIGPGDLGVQLVVALRVVWVSVLMALLVLPPPPPAR